MDVGEVTDTMVPEALVLDMLGLVAVHGGVDLLAWVDTVIRTTGEATGVKAMEATRSNTVLIPLTNTALTVAVMVAMPGLLSVVSIPFIRIVGLLAATNGWVNKLCLGKTIHHCTLHIA